MTTITHLFAILGFVFILLILISLLGWARELCRTAYEWRKT